MFASSGKRDEFRLHGAAVHLEEEHRSLGRPATLRRASRIQDPQVLEALDLRLGFIAATTVTLNK